MQRIPFSISNTNYQYQYLNINININYQYQYQYLNISTTNTPSSVLVCLLYCLGAHVMDKNNLNKRIAFASENFQAKYPLKREITKSAGKEKKSRRQLADKINPHFLPFLASWKCCGKYRELLITACLSDCLTKKQKVWLYPFQHIKQNIKNALDWIHLVHCEYLKKLIQLSKPSFLTCL